MKDQKTEPKKYSEKIISVKGETSELIRKLADKEDRTIRSIVDRAVRYYAERG